jgi:hypothetical protein
MHLKTKANSLVGKVDNFILDMITDYPNLELQTCIGNLTWNRFDLAIKIDYLEYICGCSSSCASEAYLEHIKAFSLGTFKERGNDCKNSASSFTSAFYKLFTDIKENGFDIDKSYVPLAKDGSILNGAHRVAISKFLNVPIHTVKTNIEPFTYDYKFFKNRGVSTTILDNAAIKYAEESSNCYLALLWPSSQTNSKLLVEKYFSKLVYSKSIKLDYNGAHNLLSIAYDGEVWLGAAGDNYPGVKNKLVKCFPNFGNVRAFLFEEDDLDAVLALKESIRQQYGVGKHSIHITDTKAEVIALANLVFNDNGVNFLNHAYPNKLKSAQGNLDLFKHFIKENKLELENYALDTGMVLAIYGLREASDIDYITSSKAQPSVSYKLIENHSDYVVFHNKDPLELVFDSKLHFKFQGVKFISLSQLKVMKGNRNEAKDKADLALITSIDCISDFQIKISQIKYKFLFFKAKISTGIKVMLINLFSKLGIYSFVRHLYRNIKGKK